MLGFAFSIFLQALANSSPLATGENTVSQCYGDQSKTNFVYFHNYKRKTINLYYSLFTYLS